LAERDALVAALAAEVLGPRGGLRERLEAPTHRAGDFVTPLDEYITGVLAPRDAAASEEIDAADDLLGENDEGADDQGDSGAPAVPPGVAPTTGPGHSPSLDPRSRPCSLGLTVLVEGDRPTVDVCTTWAWYEQAGTTAWQREPRYELWTGVDCTVPSAARERVEVDGVRAVAVQVRCRPAGSAWRVSIFVLNTSRAAQPGAEHHVYQPQIRLRLGAGSRLAPISADAPSDDQEGGSLALLYASRRAMARGHLCSAVWREVDPERPFEGPRPSGTPFTWVDGELLPPGLSAGFNPPDARTELVPCYFVSAPSLEAAERHGAAVFDPSRLCELWNSDDIRAALSPVADGYESWINDQRVQAAELSPGHQATAALHLQSCDEVLRRLREAVDLLCNDSRARLAFCFANKAMATQSQWIRNRVDRWRPFQLVFQLINLPAIRYADAADRQLCDLLWIPTGGGKTEAYLGLAAFAFALRRLTSADGGNATAGRGAGVAVLSRYTLRLLTIQQFRRALALVTACETLRVWQVGSTRGWRPQLCHGEMNWLWGRSRFSIGLWVGGSVTPNGLFTFSFPGATGAVQKVWGALSILRGDDNGEGEGEPAQVLKCPCCQAILAVPPEGFPRDNSVTMHLVIQAANMGASPAVGVLSSAPQQIAGSQAADSLFAVSAASVTSHQRGDYHTVTIDFVPSRDVAPGDVDTWIRSTVIPAFGRRTRLVSARGSRPGYFFRTAPFRGGRQNDVDFDLFCPNPGCNLNTGSSWSELTPAGVAGFPEAFEIAGGESSRVPIPALTVDDQIYQRCPTVVVATVDKFARLAFEPRAAAMFGIVDHYCDRHGYYRAGCPPNWSQPSSPSDHPTGVTPIGVAPFEPPDLILQDELHLIEGPLGSMVGIYETAIDNLATRTRDGQIRRPKYIASSATVRRAADQVRALYDRALAQFPPPGIDIDDNFFAVGREAHPMDAAPSGRLYVGVCAPGRGAQTPIVRIWSRLLQQMEARRQAGALPTALDPFWTLVGYFNAIRELAGAVALARQDIPERMAFVSASPRAALEQEPMELSSRASSLELPGMLERLATRLDRGAAVNTVVSTSMFGTGVDVSRLGLMVVHGQPKTSSSYIQATGRVGREAGGLVVTFYRAARPRDLSHYEFFVGYHRELYRHVEPVTVNPFSPRARDRALGPVAVALLRQAAELTQPNVATTPVLGAWRVQQRFTGGVRCRAGDMAGAQASPEVSVLPVIFEARSMSQPPARRPQAGLVAGETGAEIARWAQIAALAGQGLLYFESSLVFRPTSMVVLGDLAHEALGLPVAYENAPNSLREVESSATFRGRS
jgi:hypothetical protein